jgi:CheY-like chemotaxis protein/HPt (histidine-containing phosphotransfer) domain-containing protein
VAAASGAEALEILQREDLLDLAIVDMQMPEMDGVTLAEEIRRQQPFRDLPLILTTSFGSQDLDAHIREFAAILTKPVKPSQLYNSLIDLFTSESRKSIEPRDEQPEALGFDKEMGERLPLRILLAEDNPINQQLALLTLERLGYQADVAGNGLEVLEAFRLHPYDVILMDVQMPEMDGIEVTQHIRREYSVETQPRIIALTANAMQDDRDHCLAAGMDDYMSKPFEVQELVAALQKCPVGRGYAPNETAGSRQQTAGRRQKAQREVAPSYVAGPEDQKSDEQVNATKPQTSILSMLDPAAIQRLRVNLGKRAAEMIPVLVENFFDNAAKLQEDARQAFERHQPEELCRAVHTLKSNSKTFGATEFAELCQELENSAKTGELEHAEELFMQIANEYLKVKAALESLQQSL